MSKWQPIETAPKDGTRILAYQLGCKSADLIEWRITHNRWMTTDGFMYEPYGWMPLPDVPLEETK